MKHARIYRPGGFTLIELLVSMTVLSLLVLLISQLFSSATSVTVSNRKRLDADSQARLVFDHMALDFGRMLKRNDVDYLFGKATDPSGGQSGQSTQAKNDAMYFYSEAPAFYDDTSSSPIPRSSLALVGYRINKAFQLERLGKQLSWDGVVANSSPGPGGIMYLSATPTPGGSATPDPNILDVKSTLVGNWPLVIGTAMDSPAPYTNTTDDADYQVLAEQVCRLEFCFLLTDGTYSPLPICPITGPIPVPPNVLPGVNLSATIGPTMNDDSTKTGPTLVNGSKQNYAVGSRWYDVLGNRGYVCVNSTPKGAVWNPLGVQDVRAIVVALAILDSTSSRTVRTTAVTMDNRNLQVPKLDALSAALADANPSDVISPSGSQPQPSPTAPFFPTPPSAGSTPEPAILMAEAWNNITKLSTFPQSSGLSSPVAAQVRVYQRIFVLNNQ